MNSMYDIINEAVLWFEALDMKAVDIQTHRAAMLKLPSEDAVLDYLRTVS